MFIEISKSFHRVLAVFLSNRNVNNEDTLQLINEIDRKAEKDSVFAIEWMNWITKRPGCSTLHLRELCKEEDWVFLRSLREDNAINELDTFHMYYHVAKPNDTYIFIYKFDYGLTHCAI